MNTTPLKWINLKQNKCPKCNRDFTKGMGVEFREDLYNDKPTEKLLTHKCGFSIREKRYSEIVNSQVTHELERKWDQEEEE